jgi:hypothetical protein
MNAKEKLDADVKAVQMNMLDLLETAENYNGEVKFNLIHVTMQVLVKMHNESPGTPYQVSQNHIDEIRNGTAASANCDIADVKRTKEVLELLIPLIADYTSLVETYLRNHVTPDNKASQRNIIFWSTSPNSTRPQVAINAIALKLDSLT